MCRLLAIFLALASFPAHAENTERWVRVVPDFQVDDKTKFIIDPRTNRVDMTVEKAGGTILLINPRTGRIEALIPKDKE